MFGLILVLGGKWIIFWVLVKKVVSLMCKCFYKEVGCCCMYWVLLFGGVVGKFDVFLENVVCCNEIVDVFIILNLVWMYGEKYWCVLCYYILDC